jgi:glycosyltransferase involved in cell wall biosynthesis
MTSRLQLRGHCYSHFPWLIIQEGDESTIGSGVAEDHAKVLRLLNEVQYPLTNYYIAKPLRIGVIIPTYKGHLHLLKRCLDCIQAQTRQPDVVAISFSSVQYADLKQIELAFYTFPIRLILTDRVQYAAANRNRAIQLIADDVDVIVCQDGDDEMYPYRLAYTEKAFRETNCDFVASSYTVLLSDAASVPPTMTHYKAYPEALIADPGNIHAPQFHPYYIHDMLIPSGSVLGLIVRPEIQSENRDIHHGQMAFTPAVWKRHQFSELEVDRRREDSIFGRKISLLGFKGTYISTPLIRYHCYDK